MIQHRDDMTCRGGLRSRGLSSLSLDNGDHGGHSLYDNE